MSSPHLYASPSAPNPAQAQEQPTPASSNLYQKRGLRRVRTLLEHPTKKVKAGSLLAQYRRSVKSLEILKAKHFHHGTPVIVDCARYKGPGIAVTDGECWPDHVAVSLPNGNTWRYPLEAVEPDVS